MNGLFVFVSALLAAAVYGELVCDAPHEVHSNVTPMCPRNCKTNKHMLCLGLINKESCQCEQGYIRASNEDKTCIREEDCPVNESPFEEVKPLLCEGDHEYRYNYTPVCPLTCESLNKARCMALLDRPSCQCRDGTVRDTTTNKCVAIKDCAKFYDDKGPVVCNGPNEKFSEWVSACPQTCDKKAQTFTCQAIVHKPSCVCINGTIRDTVNNVCVAPDECPPKANQELVCDPLTENLSQVKTCHSTCQTPWTKFCDMIVEDEPNCICKPGYIRDEVTGNCVHFKDCPKY